MTAETRAASVPGLREKICYGCGDFSSNLLWGISGGFLMYYYTDTLRLAAADIAVLLLVTRVFDALADPTHTTLNHEARPVRGSPAVCRRPYL